MEKNDTVEDFSFLCQFPWGLGFRKRIFFKLKKSGKTFSEEMK